MNSPFATMLFSIAFADGPSCADQQFLIQSPSLARKQANVSERIQSQFALLAAMVEQFFLKSSKYSFNNLFLFSRIAARGSEFFFAASLANVTALEPFEFVFKVFMVCQSQSIPTRVGCFKKTSHRRFVRRAMQASALRRPSENLFLQNIQKLKGVTKTKHY